VPKAAARILCSLEDRVYLPKDTVILYDDFPDGMYFIDSGVLGVYSQNDELLAELGEGSFFGEIALLLDRKRSASVLALTWCNVKMLSKVSFDNVLKDLPLDIHKSIHTKMVNIANSRVKHEEYHEEDEVDKLNSANKKARQAQQQQQLIQKRKRRFSTAGSAVGSRKSITQRQDTGGSSSSSSSSSPKFSASSFSGKGAAQRLWSKTKKKFIASKSNNNNNENNQTTNDTKVEKVKIEMVVHKEQEESSISATVTDSDAKKDLLNSKKPSSRSPASTGEQKNNHLNVIWTSNDVNSIDTGSPRRTRRRSESREIAPDTPEADETFAMFQSAFVSPPTPQPLLLIFIDRSTHLTCL
jgi:CRP-like cAMP-binding protein